MRDPLPNAAHLDASAGVSVPGLLGALVSAGLPPSALKVRPGISVSVSSVRSSGISAARVALKLKGAPPARLAQLEADAVRAGFRRLGISRISVGPVGVPPGAAPAAISHLKGFEACFPPAGILTLSGAVLLAELAPPGPSPPLRISAIGHGMPFLRLVLGRLSGQADQLWEVRTNLDDCSPQVFDHLGTRLFAAGARDVALVPIQMKKGRPAVCLEVLCDDAALAPVEDLILTETPTLGVRRHRVERRILPREIRAVTTRFGSIRVKRALDPRGVWKAMPEYDDCRRAAARTGAPLREIMAEALAASVKAKSRGR